MDKCEVCGARAGELRRGRCWGCYSRWVEARPVGFGASCRLCGERRRSHLRSIELMGLWSPVCHNCAARVEKMHPMPDSVDDLRLALRRERRQFERRATSTDLDRPSTVRDRRTGDRRASAHADGSGPVIGTALHFHDSSAIDDDDIALELAELASELEAVADDLGEAADLTRIHDLGR
jgi:hypothetical protein